MGVGKIIGFIIGYMLGGWFLGLVGLFFGYLSDLFRHNRFIQHAGIIRQLFFEKTFLIMGHAAKADGQVSENDLNAARIIMQRMHLNHAQQLKAMQWFNNGKQADFQLTEALTALIHASQHNFILLQLFADTQLQAAKLSGDISPEKQTVLNSIFSALNSQPFEYYSRTYSSRSQQFSDQEENLAAKDYALLGVSLTASNDDIKKAYRRLINQHHPDKLMAKGLPAEMLKIATEKAQAIQLAYDRIRKLRDF